MALAIGPVCTGKFTFATTTPYRDVVLMVQMTSQLPYYTKRTVILLAVVGMSVSREYTAFALPVALELQPYTLRLYQQVSHWR